ncbi:uncharacterized protein CPUR_03111 [Claviceps purpurea 20.1]|uniref:F-box domain-containing protein n=1 Tax=Claviceps purpurea (strain 20.1) TaxID=1111077 RepID=M1W8Q8_CLAP2|nr:uncharacterized protein CPUR_03111 [Claviceps purpurea 20.1]
MADLVESGRGKIESARAYNAAATKENEGALEILTMAIRSCPCARGIAQRTCGCKSFEEMAAYGEPIFEEAMADHYECKLLWKSCKCDNVHHIQALDLRSAMYETMGQLRLAVEDAEWMLELAPRLPDGYLRLGNLARLQNKNDYAWKLYAAGIKANKGTAPDSSPKLQQLYTLYRHTFRKDPLCLPAEIVGLIFSYLSWNEIIVVLRVSKKWNRELTSPVHGILWRDIVFPYETEYYWTMPRPDQMRKILSWAGDGGARKIVIRNGTGFPEPLVMQLLKSSPSLEHLVLHHPLRLSLPSNKNIWNKLKNVSISSESYRFWESDVDSPGGFPRTFLQNAGSSLEHLSLVAIPSQWYHGTLSIPFLPKLKTLQLNGARDTNGLFPIFSLSVTFPRLEQLQICEDMYFLGLEPTEIWRGNWDDVWPHLKVLKVKCNPLLLDDESATSIMAIRYLTALKSLQHLYLLFQSEDWPHLFCGSHGLLSDLDVSRYSDFENLRSVRLLGVNALSPHGARTLLSNAIKTKQLTTYDLVFPEESSTGNIGDTSIRHLLGYDWMRGAPSIHTLGCFQFRFPIDAETDEDLPLPQFLATFPNLRTLIISSQEYSTSEFVKLVVAILKVTHLKTIYTPSVDGVFLDQLKETAKKYGVQAFAHRPPDQWPMSLD